VADEITLTLPRERDFHRVAHLVLGGLAVRLELTIENLEDLQIALDAILDGTDPARGDITVRMRVSDGELETVGRFDFGGGLARSMIARTVSRE